MAFRNELLLEWQKREFITTGSMAAKITLEKISAKTGYSVAELLGQDDKK